MTKTKSKSKSGSKGNDVEKIPLLLLDFFLGGISASRFYAGETTTAVIKLVLLIVAIAGFTLVSPIVGILLLAAWYVWNLVDAFWVSYNIMNEKPNLPFGSKKQWKKSERKNKTAKILANVYLVLLLIAVLPGYIASLIPFFV